MAMSAGTITSRVKGKMDVSDLAKNENLALPHAKILFNS